MWEKCTLSIYLAPSQDSRRYILDLTSQQVYIMNRELHKEPSDISQYFCE